MIEIKNKTKNIRRSLPYQGSKQAISGEISSIIKEQFGNDKTVYDLFGGGAAVSKQLLNDGFNVVYNELNKNIYDAVMNFQNRQSKELYDNLILNREEFYETLNKEDKNYIDIMKLLVNSFSNNGSSYIYGKETEKIKVPIIEEIYKNYNTYLNYKETEEYKKSDIRRLVNLEYLNRVINFSDSIEIKNSYNESYDYFSNIKNAILYLDPPYQNTLQTYNKDNNKKPEISKEIYNSIRNELINDRTKEYIIYKNFKCTLGKNGNNYNRMYCKYIDIFDSKKFYDWAFEMSKNNIVLISSYEISDPRFEEIYNFNKRNNFGNHANRKNKNTEKLFAAKKI